MKPNLLNYSTLTIGIAAALGVAGTAHAAKSTGESTPTIENVATATYSIDGVAQNAVESNKVVVNITQSGAFSLEAKNNDGNLTDDYNKALTVTPKGRVTFNHTLTNSGNVEDTYTLNLANGGTIPGVTAGAGTYDLAETSVTYTIFNKDRTQVSTKTVSGTEFQNTKVVLKPNEYVDIAVAAKTKGNVGGSSQNLTLTATSAYFTVEDVTKATLTNINNSTTKVPVFQITNTVSNTLNLNNPSSVVTYTIKIKNDNRADYAADATNIVVFDGLPAGLRLADDPKLSASNNATIKAGSSGEGSGSALDSIEVTLLNLKVGEEATITFNAQRDTSEPFKDPKNIVNHTLVSLNLGEGQIIYDSTDPNSTQQNTGEFYPTTDDSEVINGTANNAIGGDSAAPLTANQRAIDLGLPSRKEIPVTTSTNNQVTQSVVITNSGKEIEGDKPGEIKFTIAPEANSKVTVVSGSVEIIYDPDNNPATPNYTYAITRDINGDNDLSSAVPKNGAPAWTGMAPNSTVTINYKVKSESAVVGTEAKTTVTLVVGGVDVPTVGERVVTNITTVKGLKLFKEQALNDSCSATATLSFTDAPVAAKPGNCIVYKITAFNDFSVDNPFTFSNVAIADTIDRFKNKAQVLTTSDFAVKLDDVANKQASPNTNKYNATINATQVSGTVTSLAPQKYAAMTFAVKINE